MKYDPPKPPTRLESRPSRVGPVDGEVMVNGRRAVLCPSGTKPYEIFIEKIGFDLEITEVDDKYYLFLPSGSRNAESLLSGIEAYPGEKIAVVKYVFDYMKSLVNAGLFDPGLGLKNVGVVRQKNTDYFTIPSEYLTSLRDLEDSDIEEWFKSIYDYLVLLCPDIDTDIRHIFGLR